MERAELAFRLSEARRLSDALGGMRDVRAAIADARTEAVSELRAEGVSLSRIAEVLGVSVPTAHEIANRKKDRTK